MSDLATGTDPEWVERALDAVAEAIDEEYWPGQGTVNDIIDAALPVITAGVEQDLREKLADEIRRVADAGYGYDRQTLQVAENIIRGDS